MNIQEELKEMSESKNVDFIKSKNNYRQQCVDARQHDTQHKQLDNRKWIKRMYVETVVMDSNVWGSYKGNRYAHILNTNKWMIEETGYTSHKPNELFLTKGQTCRRWCKKTESL